MDTTKVQNGRVTKKLEQHAVNLIDMGLCQEKLQKTR
jgi:hypothetical protein